MRFLRGAVFLYGNTRLVLASEVISTNFYLLVNVAYSWMCYSCTWLVLAKRSDTSRNIQWNRVFLIALERYVRQLCAYRHVWPCEPASKGAAWTGALPPGFAAGKGEPWGELGVRDGCSHAKLSFLQSLACHCRSCSQRPAYTAYTHFVHQPIALASRRALLDQNFVIYIKVYKLYTQIGRKQGHRTEYMHIPLYQACGSIMIWSCLRIFESQHAARDQRGVMAASYLHGTASRTAPEGGGWAYSAQRCFGRRMRRGA